MNKTRRKWLADVISQLEEKRDELWNIYEDEEMAYDNLPYFQKTFAYTQTIS